ncbi:hypothetical protein EJ05DRAFT_476918 [Pseudovirgaria hyperparasitica]|uniref:Stress-response A/B barrel domain-containing protein n=1 Tax=Pseudovirgaria hyperparasitica TaxID=470096 RepID=A0A6A6W6P3_9PEZI|nr:uncharacterized protein EJ05DRAFT_476918 [Pseudovirgaria hyperparasitica]KAF2757704.1 hypothetical protein EJ05DRAFT_476918 [Pseudovirgaria hyperparasitica]
MAVYHVVLFKRKPEVSDGQIATWKAAASGMVGRIPGLHSLKVGPPHASTAHRSQGFNVAVIAVLDGADTIKVYAEHPVHLELLKMGRELFAENLAYDMEF